MAGAGGSIEVDGHQVCQVFSLGKILAAAVEGIAGWQLLP